jgi:hypothetical protein
MIAKYVHRCIVPDGDMEGSKNWVEVDAMDVELDMKCETCGEPLATPRQIVAHIYEELLK